MAFSDFDTSDCCVVKAKGTAIFGSSNGLVVPTNEWQIEILDLPFNTTYDEIQKLFVKYGTIDKLALIYNSKNKDLNCFLSFENSSNSEEALKESGKKVGMSFITVIKYANSGTTSQPDKGNKRMRTEDVVNDWGSSNAETGGSWGTATTTPTTSDQSGGWGSTNDTNSWSATNDNSWGASSSPQTSRGRGRGRGGASGGGRSCFKCGEEGHMSRECPKGGGNSRSCFKCGEEGHMSRECPKGGGSSRACFKCGEEGHMSRECPKGGGGGSRGCFNCGEEGHMSRECSKPRSGRGRGRGGANGGNRGNSGNSGGNEWGNESSAPVNSPITDWD